MAKKSDKEEFQHKGLKSGNRLLIISFFLAIFVLSIISFQKFITERLINTYTPLIHAVMEIRFKTTNAHLWFEEIISGDSHEDISQVWESFNDSDSLSLSMLSGKLKANIDIIYQENYLFIREEKINLTPQVELVYKKLKGLRSLAKLRSENMAKSGVGSDLDQEFDDFFYRYFTGNSQD